MPLDTANLVAIDTHVHIESEVENNAADEAAKKYFGDTGVPRGRKELAEWLVGHGMPFREAHGVVGALVRESLERRVPMAELIASHPSFEPDALALLEPVVALRRQRTPGSAGPDSVAIQLERFAVRIREDAERVAAWRR